MKLTKLTACLFPPALLPVLAVGCGTEGTKTAEECAEEISELGSVCPVLHRPVLGAKANAACETSGEFSSSEDSSSGAGDHECTSVGECLVYCEATQNPCSCGIASIGGDDSIVCVAPSDCDPDCGDDVCGKNEDHISCARDCPLEDDEAGGGSSSKNDQEGMGGASSSNDAEAPDCTTWDPSDNLSEKGVLVSGSSDCYAFTLDEVGEVSITFADYDGKIPGLRLYQDDNQNGLFELSESFSDNYPSNPNNPSLSLPLEKGDYYFVVDTAKTEYRISATYKKHSEASPDEDPGEHPDKSAHDLGELGSARVGGYVGKVDEDDYYRFDVQEAGTVTVTFADYKSKVPGLVILADENENGLLEPSEQLADNYPGNPGGPSISTLLPSAGKYFLRVYYADTTYTLSATFE